MITPTRAAACAENMHGLNPYWVGDVLKSVDTLLARIDGVVDERLLADLRGQLRNLYCGRLVRNTTEIDSQNKKK